MSDFPNILVIKLPDAEGYQGEVAVEANFGYADQHGVESLHERYNLLPIPEGQKNAGKYGVYVPNVPFPEGRAGKGWLVFMVSTPKGGGRSLIGWYENAELLASFESRTDVRVAPSGEDNNPYPCYQIVAETAYAFKNKKDRPFVERLKKFPNKKAGMGQVHKLFLRKNNRNIKDYSSKVIEELMTLKQKAFKSKKATNVLSWNIPSLLIASTQKTFSEITKQEAKESGFSDEVLSKSEGLQVVKTHIVRERNSKLRPRFLRSFKKKYGFLYCENCKFPENFPYQNGSDILEVHHKVPLSSARHTGKTKLEDLALLCPNCHRATHRGLIKGFITE